MTTEIERLAKEAGMTAYTTLPAQNALGRSVPIAWLEKFAALVAEECAKVCDSLADGPEVTPSQQFALDLASDAIRAKFAQSGLKDAAK